jgi:hypothetical protein
MRGIVTWLIVGAVAMLAGAAAVDAIRDDREEPSRPAASSERLQRGSARTRLRSSERAPVSGLLVYADPSCRVFAIGLTALRPHVPSGVRSCRFRFSPGDVLSFGRDLSSPRRTESARCRHGGVELLARHAIVARFRGCSPAWKPDGTLTFISRGEVVAVYRCAAVRCERDVVLGDDVGGGRVANVEWLSNSDAAVIVHESKDGSVLAVLEAGRMAARSRPWTRLSRLRSSSAGRYVAARSDRPPGLILFDRRLRAWSFIEGARAIAWSPDERLAAVVTRGGIEIVGATDLKARFRLGFQAVDVAWR